ncbi:peptidylprolyl isomerase [Mobilicoccus massiliensis]|uniref:peptidylprolyl isomerase n=1 Tax=Mobilicoccus massiliensis TaxID=1522310 RepID=UPI0005907E5A|nr:peptidylprolyl isomerase [Mobilicoccus massiliensis]
MTPRTLLRCAATALAAGSLLLPQSAQATTSTATKAPRQKWVNCTFTPTPENPAARPVDPPPAKTKGAGIVHLRIRTNYGPMTFVLQRDSAPCAVANIVSLVKQDFYDESQCWRFTDTERLGVLQCGDIYRQEEGGPGYRFDDEVSPSNTYPRGTLAMGNQGPGTNGSEFFVVHSHANIKPEYTILGRMSSGFRTLDAIAKAGTVDKDGDGLPTRPVVITDVSVR